MKLLIGYLLFFIITTNAFAQSIDQTPCWQMNTQSFYIDVLGNFYLINKNEISKYNSSIFFLGRYSNKQLGNNFEIDVTNPLKTLVFNSELSLIIYLDNMLNKSTTEINLNELDLGTATKACSSNNGGFWLYNPINFQLLRFNENLNKITEVNFLNQITGLDIKPEFMREANNLLYISDRNNGILVFDIFGTYVKTIPLKNISFFVIDNNQLFYKEDDKLKSYDLKLITVKEIDFPKNINGWAISGQSIFISTNQGICLLSGVK